MRFRRAALIVVALLLPQPLDAQGTHVAKRSGPYTAILDLYRRGEAGAAVEALLKLGPQATRLPQDVLRSERLPADPLVVYAPAAAMLHTDTADVLWLVAPSRALEHFAVARQWADATSDVKTSFRPPDERAARTRGGLDGRRRTS